MAKPATPEEQAPEEQAPAPKSMKDDVLAHFADPANVPLPEGVVINFGDSEPIRKAQ